MGTFTKGEVRINPIATSLLPVESRWTSAED